MFGMPRLETMHDVQEWLNKSIAGMRELNGKDLTVTRMSPLMKRLGDPHDRLKVIHVAGTSGKTSTAYYLASLLRAAGKDVGLTVSPHIDTIRERFQINLEPISEKDFVRHFKGFVDRIGGLVPYPTYFEILIGFALWYFHKSKADYAVVETGIGGLHDATNIINSPSKVCVITDIGFDHMHVLGKSISEISEQKVGIVHPGNVVFVHKQSEEIMKSILQHVQRTPESQLYIVDDKQIPGLPLFQSRNWSLAEKVIDFVADRNDWPKPSFKQKLESQTIHIPGRMELYQIGNRQIIIDGAHNSQKMSALVSSLGYKFPNQKFSVIVAFKQSKDYKSVLDILKPIVTDVNVAKLSLPNNIHLESQEPKKIVDYCQLIGIDYVNSYADIGTAILKCLNQDSDLPILITGSLYLAAEARKEFNS